VIIHDCTLQTVMRRERWCTIRPSAAVLDGGRPIIDNPAQVIDLMGKIEAQLPIPANPTSATIRQLRAQGLKIGAGRALFIQRVFYSGDEGGILCDVTPTKDAKSALVISITHLRVAPNHPLARDIRAYQQQRLRRIAQSNG
jgi:hypothetical protein